jgi:short-subunit dehydrogenase
MRLSKNTVAVVTGAASGIGKGIASELSKRGCRLALVDLNETALQETVVELSRTNQHVTAHMTDVSSECQMRNLVTGVLQEHGQVHLLVNNAGVSVASPFAQLDLPDFQWLMAVNFWGTVFGCKFFLPHLAASDPGAIVNILSDFALIGFPTKTCYSASKFALRGFSEALRAELYGSSVSLTCVYPGPVDTNLVRSSRAWDLSKKHLEAEFLEKRGLPIEYVGRRIVNGIERGRARVLIGRETYLFDMMARIFPVITNSVIGRVRERIPFV